VGGSAAIHEDWSGTRHSKPSLRSEFMVITIPLILALPLLAQLPMEKTLPNWTHLSSMRGDLPAPGTSAQQTACLVLDIDKDGLNDIVIGSRSAGAQLVWYRRRAQGGWAIYPIDAGLNIEAGGASADIDGDGDMDLVFGEDFSGKKVYWWENPAPRFDPPGPWARREIKGSGGVDAPRPDLRRL